jgi:hypothetical protein
MARDLIIGGASGYDWDQIKPWAKSIKETGFEGDVILCITNATMETCNQGDEFGLLVHAYGDRSEQGFKSKAPRTAPHVERMFYVWNALNETKEDYRYVIFTDVRDVIFQVDPSIYLESTLSGWSEEPTTRIVASSEGLKYKDEPWGDNNVLETFGAFFQETLREKEIYNVGTIAGEFEYMRDLILLIFQQSVNRPIPIVDQAVFNFLINQKPISDIIHKSNSEENWAVQLGTTEEAIKAGAGMIGEAYLKNPSALVEYKLNYNSFQPHIHSDGIVSNQRGIPYTIVHQWDRIPYLKNKIEERYA